MSTVRIGRFKFKNKNKKKNTELKKQPLKQ